MKDGKVFGKLNVIDLLVIIIAIIIVVAVALKVTGRAGAARTETGTSIRYTVKAEGIDRKVYESIENYIAAAKAAGKPGDQLMASGELLNGYVTSVTATPKANEATVSTSTGSVYFTAGRDDLVDLTFEVEGYVANNIKTELGTQEVRAGKGHILKTTHFELSYATILSVEWEGGTGAGY